MCVCVILCACACVSQCMRSVCACARQFVFVLVPVCRRLSERASEWLLVHVWACVRAPAFVFVRFYVFLLFCVAADRDDDDGVMEAVATPSIRRNK